MISFKVIIFHQNYLPTFDYIVQNLIWLIFWEIHMFFNLFQKYTTELNFNNFCFTLQNTRFYHIYLKNCKSAKIVL